MQREGDCRSTFGRFVKVRQGRLRVEMEERVGESRVSRSEYPRQEAKSHVSM